MAFQDLRSFIDALAQEKELAIVEAEVDWRDEIQGIVRKTFDDKGPALLFKNIKDYQTPLFVGGVATYDRFALALGLPSKTPLEEIVQEFSSRIVKPLKSKTVDSGPCKENILFEKDIDVTRFPVPLWNEMDGGRYFGTWHTLITQDPDTDWLNAGIYRMMIHDRNKLGVLLAYDQHIGMHYLKYKKLGKAMPAAVAVGLDPTIPIAAATPFDQGVNEFDMAGAIRREPVELVKCETSDLLVPASAEIVLEGEIPIDERTLEGPFGEWVGHYGGKARPRPVFNIKCVTFRNDPIYRGTLEGKPINEDHICTSISLSALTKNFLTEGCGIQGIRSVFFPACAGGWGMAVVAVKQHYPGHSRRVAHALLGSKMGAFVKNVIVVDDDINPFNLDEVWWATVTRLQASRGVNILTRGKTAVLDPSQTSDMRGFTDTMIMEAVKPYEWKPRPEWNNERFPPVAYPSEEVMKKVEKNWVKYGIK
ncbi:MAG: UbiD family decarboxylase [Deltaproteobacteria bacterium]|nr:UbiD family decarboxylase [Deltaproteobacteria bacterium]